MSPAMLPSARWSSAIQQEMQDSPYCSKAWLDLITAVYGYSLIPIIRADAAGRVTGFLPLYLLSSPLRGRRLVALPFSDQCPLLAADATTAGRLIDDAIQLAEQQQARYLELRTGEHEVLAARSDLEARDLYVRWRMSLDAGLEAVWKRIKSPVRHQVEKAQRLGVRIRFANCRSDMAMYHWMHVRTRTRKHGVPAQPLRYFNGLWDAFSESGKLQVLFAEYEGETIAGMVILASGTVARYAYGASDERFLQLAPNNLLMWTAIAWACEHGYQTFDFGRTARDNPGLMQFKRGWGGTEEALTYYYYPCAAGLATTSEQSRKYRMLTACWKRLPLPIAASLGGYLYKHLG